MFIFNGLAYGQRAEFPVCFQKKSDVKHMHHNGEQLLKDVQVAARMQLAVATIRRWRIEGKGPRFVRLGGAVRYHVGDVEAWIEGGGQRAA